MLSTSQHSQNSLGECYENKSSGSTDRTFGSYRRPRKCAHLTDMFINPYLETQRESCGSKEEELILPHSRNPASCLELSIDVLPHSVLIEKPPDFYIIKQHSCSHYCQSRSLTVSGNAHFLSKLADYHSEMLKGVWSWLQPSQMPLKKRISLYWSRAQGCIGMQSSQYQQESFYNCPIKLDFRKAKISHVSL